MFSQPYDDHHRSHDLTAMTETICFICNKKYFTNIISYQTQTRLAEASKGKAFTLCQVFNLNNEVEMEELLLLAQFTDPFCLNCSQKIIQIHDWGTQLELLQKGIEGLKADIGKLIIQSFPHSHTIGGAYHLKSKIAKYYTGSDFHIISSTNRESFQEVINETGSELLISNQNSSEGHDDCSEDQHDMCQNPTSGSGYSPSSKQLASKRKAIQNPNEMRRKKKKLINSAPKQCVSQRTLPKGENQKAVADGQCHLCPKKFPNQVALSRHIKRQHSGITYPCRYCGKEFNCYSNKCLHEKSVHIAQSKDFICDSCGKAFKTKILMNTHVKMIHERHISRSQQKIPSQCSECGLVYDSHKLLYNHVRNMHILSHSILCTICARPFKTSSAMEIHQKTHISAWEEGKLPLFYQCQICAQDEQLGFSCKIDLASHYRQQHPTLPHTNTYVKDYKKPAKKPKKFFCPTCPDHPGFCERFALKVHINSGHKRKFLDPKECRICGKPNIAWTITKIHEQTHHPKGFCCEICHDVTLRPKEMIAHYITIHPNMKVPALNSLDLRKDIFKYFCTDCPTDPGFRNKKALSRHLRQAHIFSFTTANGEKLDAEVKRTKYFCTSCPSHPGFLEKSALKNHTQSAHKRKFLVPNECKICGKPNIAWSVTKVHEQTHHPKGFCCEICNDVTTRPKEMTKHYKEAHPSVEIPPLESLDLRKNIFTHFCSECTKQLGFRNKRSLENHMNQEHRKIQLKLGRKRKCYVENLTSEDNKLQKCVSILNSENDMKVEGQMQRTERKCVYIPGGQEEANSSPENVKLRDCVLKLKRVDRNWP